MWVRRNLSEEPAPRHIERRLDRVWIPRAFKVLGVGRKQIPSRSYRGVLGIVTGALSRISERDLADSPGRGSSRTSRIFEGLGSASAVVLYEINASVKCAQPRVD